MFHFSRALECHSFIFFLLSFVWCLNEIRITFSCLHSSISFSCFPNFIHSSRFLLYRYNLLAKYVCMFSWNLVYFDVLKIVLDHCSSFVLHWMMTHRFQIQPSTLLIVVLLAQIDSKNWRPAIIPKWTEN